MKNVVVKVTSIEHGEEVIQAFNDLGVDTETFKGTETGWYYGLFDGEFNLMESPYNSQVITLEELKAMAKPYPKVMWVWDNDEEDAKKREVISEIQSHGVKYYITHNDSYGFPTIWKNAKDIEEPTEITLEQIAEKFGVDVEQIKIKK